jgi:transposase-like protein
MHVSKKRNGRPYTKRGHFMNNRPILALVERGGRVRSFHVAVADQATVCQIVRENVESESKVNTDESKLYNKALMGVLRHRRVKHTAGEYVRGDVTTNTVESYFSIFKRGMRGTYQHCAEKHLHRYLAEFDFRHNNRIALGVNDTMRAENLAEGIVGKRLTYRRANEA